MVHAISVNFVNAISGHLLPTWTIWYKSPVLQKQVLPVECVCVCVCSLLIEGSVTACRRMYTVHTGTGTVVGSIAVVSCVWMSACGFIKHQTK